MQKGRKEKEQEIQEGRAREKRWRKGENRVGKVREKRAGNVRGKRVGKLRGRNGRKKKIQKEQERREMEIVENVTGKRATWIGTWKPGWGQQHLGLWGLSVGKLGWG